MKKIISSILVIILLFAFTACNNMSDSNNQLGEEQHNNEKQENSDEKIEKNDNEALNAFEKLNEDEKSSLEEEAADLIKDYMNIEAALVYDTVYALELLGLEYKGDIFYTQNTNTSNSFILLNAQPIMSLLNDSNNYVDTGIKYSDFKNALLKYISEDYFISKYENGEIFANKNNMLYMNGGGATGLKIVSVKSELIAIEDGIYEFDAQVGINYINGSAVEKYKVNMVVVDNKLKINEEVKYISTESFIEELEQ